MPKPFPGPFDFEGGDQLEPMVQQVARGAWSPGRGCERLFGCWPPERGAAWAKFPRCYRKPQISPWWDFVGC